MTIDDLVEKGYRYDDIKHELNPRRAAKEKRLLAKDKLTKDECDWLIRNGTKIPRSKKPQNYRYYGEGDGIKSKKKVNTVPVPESVKEKIYDRFIQGEIAVEIAKDYDYTKEKVWYYIHQMRQIYPERYEEKIRREEEVKMKRKEEVVRLHNKGMKVSHIALEVDRSRTYVNKVLRDIRDDM